MAMYDKVRSWRLEGHFNATSFVIGGANGLDERVKARAKELWRLSTTLPTDLRWLYFASSSIAWIKFGSADLTIEHDGGGH